MKNIRVPFEVNLSEIINIFLLLILIILVIKLLNYKFKILYKRQLILNKNIELIEKENEIKKLNQIINEDFNQVMNLAKENSPEFLSKFKELYPYFISKIEKRNKYLNDSELIICAYFYLGFSTKDIAKIIFKSIYTIRNKRQILRNKLNIPHEEKLEKWIKNI